MLENFLELVTAVKLATRRVLTESDIKGYERHMRPAVASHAETTMRQ